MDTVRTLYYIPNSHCGLAAVEEAADASPLAPGRSYTHSVGSFSAVFWLLGLFKMEENRTRESNNRRDGRRCQDEEEKEGTVTRLCCGERSGGWGRVSRGNMPYRNTRSILERIGEK